MIEIAIPGYDEISLDHVVLDYNGTLATDGLLAADTQTLLNKVAEHVELHVVTADTFGKVKSGMERIPCKLTVLTEQDQALAKKRYLQSIGSDHAAAIGNGRNDRLMVKEAALGIAVVGVEGSAIETLLACDVVCKSAQDALELLLNPKRLVATLRS
jgi:soluble P-type ATPase